MTNILPPLCFVLAILAFIGAFALIAVGMPEPTMELHRARLGDDEEYRELMEAKWRRRQLERRLLVGVLFGCGAVFTSVGFVTMRPALPEASSR